MSVNKRKNVFISHHHKDDSSVDKLTSLLRRNGYDIRNSSIRAKPANQKRLEKGQVSDETIRRLLRRKMSWAGTVIVLVGKKTHTRPWVNWEIEQAHRQGKKIVSVFEQGLKDKVDVPEAIEKYGTSQVGWDSGNIIKAIEGDTIFENPDGTSCSRKDGVTVQC